MKIEHALLLAVPLHVDGVPRERARREPSVAGTFPGRPLESDAEDVRGDVFADVPALGWPPDHAGDLVTDGVVPAQEIGEAPEIVGVNGIGYSVVGLRFTVRASTTAILAFTEVFNRRILV